MKSNRMKKKKKYKPRRLSRCGLVLGLGLAPKVFGVPLDREIHKVNLDLADFLDFSLFEDAQDKNFYYVAPSAGGLVRNNGMPALSYAEAIRDNQKFAVLNAVFQFGVNNERFDALKAEVRRQNPSAKFSPLPMSQTSPTLVVAGVGPDSCFEAEDFVTGQMVKQCIGLTHKVQMAQKGPTLGEQLATSMVLTPAGAEIFPKLLAGGSGVQVNLEYQYKAALPAYKATIVADYKKLYESYAWFAGYHDGICTDIAISDFWERTVACAANNTDAFGKACSITVTYTDSQGNTSNNMFDILPGEKDDEATKAWYQQHAGRVNALWSAIDGLRKDFEKKFLEPVNGRRAEVDKKPTLGFALRADRSRTEEMGTYHFERDMLGSIGTKRSVIPAYTTCIKVDGTTGSVDLSSLGRCVDYYQGKVTAAQLVPVVPEFNAPSNNSGTSVGPIDWN
jgi:hypothetical protein